MLEPTKTVDVLRLCQRASSGLRLEFISQTCKKACAYDLLSSALDTRLITAPKQGKLGHLGREQNLTLMMVAIERIETSVVQQHS